MILLDSIDDFLKIDRHGEYRLCCDIDFEGKQIPKLLDDFRGVLDGNGHKVKNLVISRRVRFDGEPVALFASARNAEIKNISDRSSDRNLNILRIFHTVPCYCYNGVCPGSFQNCRKIKS